MTAAWMLLAALLEASAEAEFARARQYLDQDRAPLALEALGRVEKLRPDFPRLQYHLGLAHLKLAEFDRAAAALSAELARNPKDAEALYFRGIARAARQDLAAAERDFRGALELAPGSPTAPFQLAKLLIDTQRAEEAAPLLEKSLAIRPAYPLAHFQLGRAFQQLGQKGRAEQEFARARQLQEEERAAQGRRMASRP